MNRSLADCKAYALTTVISGVAGSGPVLPSVWLVEAGFWGPAGLWVSLPGTQASPISSRAPHSTPSSTV